MPSLSITFKASASAALSVVDLVYQAMYRFTSADTQTRITATRGRDHRQSREPVEQLGQTHFHQDCIVASATRCGPTLPNKAHAVGIEAEVQPSPRIRYPRCVAGRRACPPEDCGGPPGYAHLQRTLAGRMTGARRELLDWLGGPFDPRRFSVAQANARLARIARKAG
jgi:hypothetical protein